MITKAIGMIDKAIAMGRLRELSKQTSHTLLGGAVMLIGIVALVLSQGAALTKGGDGYELTARYGSIAGVGLGTKVLLTGIQVGEVVRRKYEPGQQRAVIVMNMRGDVEIPLDTVAMIVSDGLMGNKYIKLQPGGEVDMMRDGDEFEYVQDSIIFEEILEKVILNAEQKRRKQEEEKQQKLERDAASLRGAPAADTVSAMAGNGMKQ